MEFDLSMYPELRDALLDKVRAEAEVHRLEAAAHVLRNEHMARELLAEKSTPGNFNEYMFYNPVVDATVAKAMFEMGTWARKRPGDPFVVTFNSPGGTVTDGFALFDFLRGLSARGHEVTTKCMGVAASMGAILMQAGDVRIMTPRAYLMIHEISATSEGKLSELEDTQKVVKRFQDDALRILSARSTLSAAEIAKKWKKKDWYMGANEALELGFIDKIEE